MGTWKPRKDEARQLQRAGYDGLYSLSGECACEVSDLYPCGERGDDCTPGYKQPCNGGDECPVDGRCEWHIGATKAGG